jgi:hypothetical protein
MCGTPKIGCKSEELKETNKPASAEIALLTNLNYLKQQVNFS